jgi:hypothetical protein
VEESPASVVITGAFSYLGMRLCLGQHTLTHVNTSNRAVHRRARCTGRRRTAGDGVVQTHEQAEPPFEPTLWFLFRWGFIVIVLTELVSENADYLLRLHRSNPGPFILGTVVAIIVVFTPAVLHWRRAAPKDRMKPAIS